MAHVLEVLIIDGGDSTIKVMHSFYGRTEAECRTYYREHLHSCEYFRAAEKEGRVIEEMEHISEDELPLIEDYEDEEEEVEVD